MKDTLNHAIAVCAISQPEKFDIDLVCDRLARDGFVHIADILPHGLLLALHQEIEQLDKNYELQKAGVGRGDDYALEKKIRSDKIKWIDGETPAQVELQGHLENLRFEINRRLMLGLFDVESNFAVYRPGDFYKRHLDSFVGEKNRLLSMVIYLNPEWSLADGGLLNAYMDENAVLPFAEVIPLWGNAVIFLSEKISHEVTATTARTRYSIATWFRCNNGNVLG